MMKMRKGLFLPFLLILITALPAFAQQPVYNFGTAQAAKEMSIIPGESVTTKLYFYNVFGNKITYIKLDAAELPEGWKVTIDPPMHNVTYRIGGVEAVDIVNLYVEPTNYTDSPPVEPNREFQCGEFTCVYLMSPAGRYMLEKVVNVKAEVPLSAPLFKDYALTVSGTASWHGEPGMVTATQERSFSYNVHTIAKGGSATEEIVSESWVKGIEKYFPLLALALLISAAILIYMARPAKVIVKAAGEPAEAAAGITKAAEIGEKEEKKKVRKKRKAKKRARKKGKKRAGRK